MIVLGIDQKCERGGIRFQGPGGCISQERRAQATPPKFLVYGQSPNANGGQGRITRQTLCFVLRKVVGDASRRKKSKSSCKYSDVRRRIPAC
jgi:hypothetical protein